MAGLAGVAGVAGAGSLGLVAEDPELVEPEARGVELAVEETELALEAVLAFGSGSGVNGLRAFPPCWAAAPSVVSATACS